MCLQISENMQENERRTHTAVKTPKDDDDEDDDG